MASKPCLAMSSMAALRMAFSVSAPTDPRVRAMFPPILSDLLTLVIACENNTLKETNKRLFLNLQWISTEADMIGRKEPHVRLDRENAGQSPASATTSWPLC